MRRLVIALLALALAATSSATATAATKTVCTGVKGCKVVASVDIDGDGKSDQVGVRSSGTTTVKGGTITVRVKTAKGQILSTTGSDVHWGYQPFHGVAAIDDVDGKEIVVGDATGAHSLQWRVITYRQGKLLTLKPPAGTSLTRASRWMTDGSYSFHVGWSRKVSKSGEVTLVRKTAVRNDSGRGHSGWTTTYVRKPGKWVKKSDLKKKYSSDGAAYAIEGWHIKGLRVWPQL